jgi:molybdate transport system substrate-binding protein
MPNRSSFAIALALVMSAGATTAGEVQLAVAANFAAPAKQLAERFAQKSGHKLAVSTGSTGKFYAQISNGAPFDLFLSADDVTPSRMEREKLAVPGSRFTYAIGKLVLWSPVAGIVDSQAEVLRKRAFRRLAIANPKLAPYGAAAQQTMERLGVWSVLQSKLVQGENIAQTFQFVASGNAELGFVALAQVLEGRAAPSGSYWLVPPTLHAPLRQDAVLLARAESNAAARQFLDFLRDPAARELIRGFGYDLP